MTGENGYVVVIGSASIDVRARPLRPMERHITNPGRVRTSVGGVARNIAENLARLEVSTILLTVVGSDPAGRRVLNKCSSSGIMCDYVMQAQGTNTAANMTILTPSGEFDTAISDYSIMDYLDTDYIQAHSDLISRADMVVIDATLHDDTLALIFDIAHEAGVRVAADPTSPLLAARLTPYLNRLYLVTPNASETASLCNMPAAAHERESALQAARLLVTLGAEIAVVTLGAAGVAYADSRGGGYLKAINTEVIDSTGAGDAFTGAAIFGLLNDVPVDEAMRLGITAASLTLQSAQTVLPTLTQELLYGKLMA